MSYTCAYVVRTKVLWFQTFGRVFLKSMGKKAATELLREYVQMQSNNQMLIISIQIK